METNILFIQPSAIRGMARTLDFWGTLDDYNYSSSPKEADTLALTCDLAAVENDFWGAFEDVKTEIEKAQEEVKNIAV